MLEWKPQTFPNMSPMNQGSILGNISRDSHSFSSALAEFCYPTGHISAAPLGPEHVSCTPCNLEPSTKGRFVGKSNWDINLFHVI